MDLTEIQKALKCPKDSRNNFGKYNYRTASAILERVKELTNKPVILSDELVLIGDRYYIKATAKYGDDIAIGFAREPLTKKGMDESQITGAASTYARKNALCGLFAIDDSEDDPDSKDNDEPLQEESSAPPKSDPAKGDPLLFENWSELLRKAESMEVINNLGKKISENKTLSEKEINKLREIAGKSIARLKGDK